MNRETNGEHSKSDDSGGVRRFKLVDYTKEGRRDMPCNRATSFYKSQFIQTTSSCSLDLTESKWCRSPTISSINESQHAYSTSFLSASSSSFSVDEDEYDEHERLQFFLKIPSSRTRRRHSSVHSSRKELMLMCEQQSEGDITRSRSNKSDSHRSLKRDGYRPSLINSVLNIPDLKTVKMKYNR